MGPVGPQATAPLLDSTSHVQDFEGLVGSRRGAGCDRRQAVQHLGQLEAPVEAILELGEVTEDVAAGDRLQRADDSGLDVAEHGIHSAKARQFLGVTVVRGDDRLVGAAGPRHGAKTAQAIRHDAR